MVIDLAARIEFNVKRSEMALNDKNPLAQKLKPLSLKTTSILDAHKSMCRKKLASRMTTIHNCL